MKHILAVAVLVAIAATSLKAQDRRGPASSTAPQDRNQPPPMIPGGMPPGGFPMPGGPGFPMGGPFPPMGFPVERDYKELIPVLVDALEDGDRDIRQTVVTTLTKIGRQAVPPLTDIVKDKDKSATLRANAAYILGQIGPQAQSAIPALTKALKESDKDLRKRAAYAIASIITDDSGNMMPGPMGWAGGSSNRIYKLPDPGFVLPPTKDEKARPKDKE